MLKRRKAITDDGSIPVVTRTFIHAGTTAAIGDLTHRIRMAIIRPLCRIIRPLGFTDTGITVTRRTTAIIGATTLIRTSIGGLTVGVDMYPSHGGLTTDATGNLKTGVLAVHAV
jgi:hypothetical protein